MFRELIFTFKVRSAVRTFEEIITKATTARYVFFFALFSLIFTPKGPIAYSTNPFTKYETFFLYWKVRLCDRQSAYSNHKYADEALALLKELLPKYQKVHRGIHWRKG